MSENGCEISALKGNFLETQSWDSENQKHRRFIVGPLLQHSAYVISSALVVSGFATLLQINRVGMLGAGLLSIQGTSFAFIGIMIFAYQKLALNMTSGEALGAIFGSSAACAALMLVLSLVVRRLKSIITTNVAGATIILIELSLIVFT